MFEHDIEFGIDVAKTKLDVVLRMGKRAIHL
jgi:hypothetical protein